MKVCDLCRGEAGIEEVTLATNDDPLALGDLCATCRTTITEKGLVAGIVERAAEVRPARRRRRPPAAGSPLGTT